MKLIKPLKSKKPVVLDIEYPEDPNSLVSGTGKIVDPTTFPVQTPEVTWNGGKVGKGVVNWVVYFLTRKYYETPREATVDLFYSRAENAWEWGVPMQAATSGLAVYKIPGPGETADAALLGPLSSKDLTAYETREPDHMELAKRGYFKFGSIHHHCGAGAGQSGTDFDDEIGTPGLHITLGGLGTSKLSLHARFTDRQVQYEPKLETFFEPEALEALTDGWTRTELAKAEKDPATDERYERMAARVLKIEDIPNKAYTAYRGYQGYQGYQYHGSAGYDYTPPATEKKGKKATQTMGKPGTPSPFVDAVFAILVHLEREIGPLLAKERKRFWEAADQGFDTAVTACLDVEVFEDLDQMHGALAMDIMFLRSLLRRYGAKDDGAKMEDKIRHEITTLPGTPAAGNHSAAFDEEVEHQCLGYGHGQNVLDFGGY